MTIRNINQGTVTAVRVPSQARRKADVRDVAMRVNQFAGRRTARSSPLSQSLVLLKYQMNRREPRRERVACRGRTGTRRWSAERSQGSAFVNEQAIGVYSCLREGRNHLVWSRSEYTPNAGPVRPACPTNTIRQHLKYSEAALG